MVNMQTRSSFNKLCVRRAQPVWLLYHKNTYSFISSSPEAFLDNCCKYRSFTLLILSITPLLMKVVCGVLAVGRRNWYLSRVMQGQECQSDRAALAALPLTAGGR